MNIKTTREIQEDIYMSSDKKWIDVDEMYDTLLQFRNQNKTGQALDEQRAKAFNDILSMLQSHASFKEVKCKQCFNGTGLFRHNYHLLHNNVLLCKECQY